MESQSSSFSAFHCLAVRRPPKATTHRVTATAHHNNCRGRPIFRAVWPAAQSVRGELCPRAHFVAVPTIRMAAASDAYALQRRKAMEAKANLIQELGIGDVKAKVEASADAIKRAAKRTRSPAKSRESSPAQPVRRSSRVLGIKAEKPQGLPKEVSGAGRFECSV
jgi:hypothetical protein